MCNMGSIVISSAITVVQKTKTVFLHYGIRQVE